MLFDPLQMLVPFTVRARMVMEETWSLGLGWDDEFPSDLKRTCQEWFSQLPELSGVTWFCPSWVISHIWAVVI